MEVKGKITLFPAAYTRKNKEGKEETHIRVSGSISTKQEEGKYISKTLPVRFSGENFPASKIDKLNPDECYNMEVEEGFLVVDSFMGKDGGQVYRLAIVVAKGKLLDHKVVNRVEKPVDDDLPF